MKLETADRTPALKAAALRAGVVTAPSTEVAILSSLSVIPATSLVISSTLPRLALTPSSVAPAFCMSGMPFSSTSTRDDGRRRRAVAQLHEQAAPVAQPAVHEVLYRDLAHVELVPAAPVVA